MLGFTLDSELKFSLAIVLFQNKHLGYFTAGFVNVVQKVVQNIYKY